MLSILEACPSICWNILSKVYAYEPTIYQYGLWVPPHNSKHSHIGLGWSLIFVVTDSFDQAAKEQGCRLSRGPGSF